MKIFLSEFLLLATPDFLLLSPRNVMELAKGSQRCGMHNAVKTDEVLNVLGDNGTVNSAILRYQASRDYLSSGVKVFTLSLDSAKSFRLYVNAFTAPTYKPDTSPRNR